MPPPNRIEAVRVGDDGLVPVVAHRAFAQRLPLDRVLAELDARAR